ncbi:MAG: ATP-binding protein [Chloroflexi bacterium]|nr:ATP-binding protein [Chloroflexota bacterium]
MIDIAFKALTAQRESKHVEFKGRFDSNSSGQWCELIKDIVAISNSGGGIIVFGLDSLGIPTGESVEMITCIDPADISNKICKYTRTADFDLEIRSLEKEGHKLAGFIIKPVSIPLVFERQGAYDDVAGKHRTVFSVGTVYFRHGSKSEPGTTEDIRQVIERQLEHVRKSWIKGVKKVVHAPEGSQFIAVQSVSNGAKQVVPTSVRAVNDQSALPVRVTRDPTAASGILLHEEVSESICDEINNVIDIDRILARGQQDFTLDERVYYRIYAERDNVRQSEECRSRFLHYGIVASYAPALFWALALPDRFMVDAIVKLYQTKHPNYSLMRIGMLLGLHFCEWLFEKWRDKWEHHPQPPNSYRTFQQWVLNLKQTDARLIAARLSLTSHFVVEGNTQIEVKDILEKPDQAATLVSKACMRVFRGESDYKSIARNLDYLAYGSEVQRRAPVIMKAVMQTIDALKVPGIEEKTETEE